MRKRKWKKMPDVTYINEVSFSEPTTTERSMEVILSSAGNPDLSPPALGLLAALHAMAHGVAGQPLPFRVALADLKELEMRKFARVHKDGTRVSVVLHNP